MFSSLQVFHQQLEATKKVYVLTALTMTAEGGNNVNVPDNRKIYSLNPASRDFSLLGERNFFSPLYLCCPGHFYPGITSINGRA